MRAPLAQRLADKLENLPNTPGVYLMKDAKGRIFYVGKAKKLRDRIRSYALGTDTRRFVALLDVFLHDLEVVLVHSEKEALLLENELIKAHQPRFNVKLTDDKRFLCLRLDVRQPYPRLQVVRRFAKDGARYFGPYHSASAIREALRIINRHFQLRTCTDQVMRNRSRPCLQYQIKRCPAPCVFDLSDGTYAGNVKDVTAFLEGRQNELIEKLTERMQAHAEAMAFEAAGALRDQIHAISRSLERQRMVTSDFVNRDVVGLYRQGPAIEIHVMRTRGGRLIDARRFSFEETELETGDVLADFATRYYTEEGEVPEEILFPSAMEWSEALAALLADKAGRVVRVLVPERGDKRRLVELAEKNAHQAFVDKERARGAAKDSLERLQRALRLQKLPRHIECMDISHLMGKHIVASVVHLTDGAPDKARYRHYKIKTTEGQDDFTSMYEVVSRRLARGLAQNDLPDLLVIDGGKGQLGAAHAALRDFNVTTLDLISLAKARNLVDGEEDGAVKGRGRGAAKRGKAAKATAASAKLSEAGDAHTPLPPLANAASPSTSGPDEDQDPNADLLGVPVPAKLPDPSSPQKLKAHKTAEATGTGAGESPSANDTATDADVDVDAQSQTESETEAALRAFDEAGDGETLNLEEEGLMQLAGLSEDDGAAPASPSSPRATSAARSAERVFVLGHKNPVVLRQNSAELFVLVRARDEAHRFAIGFHRKLRQKAATRSVLDDIPGVGPKRRRDLLRHFGSVAQVQAQTEAALAEVVGKKLAALIYESLQVRGR